MFEISQCLYTASLSSLIKFIASKAGTNPGKVSSMPYLQTLDQAGKPCLGPILPYCGHLKNIHVTCFITLDQTILLSYFFPQKKFTSSSKTKIINSISKDRTVSTLKENLNVDIKNLDSTSKGVKIIHRHLLYCFALILINLNTIRVPIAVAKH